MHSTFHVVSQSISQSVVQVITTTLNHSFWVLTGLELVDRLCKAIPHQGHVMTTLVYELVGSDWIVMNRVIHIPRNPSIVV